MKYIFYELVRNKKKCGNETTGNAFTHHQCYVNHRLVTTALDSRQPAACLIRSVQCQIRLCLASDLVQQPWLYRSDQRLVYASLTFEAPEDDRSRYFCDHSFTPRFFLVHVQYKNYIQYFEIRLLCQADRLFWTIVLLVPTIGGIKLDII